MLGKQKYIWISIQARSFFINGFGYACVFKFVRNIIAAWCSLLVLSNCGLAIHIQIFLEHNPVNSEGNLYLKTWRIMRRGQ